jgi:hypothetical protein
MRRALRSSSELDTAISRDNDGDGAVGMMRGESAFVAHGGDTARRYQSLTAARVRVLEKPTGLHASRNENH